MAKWFMIGVCIYCIGCYCFYSGFLPFKSSTQVPGSADQKNTAFRIQPTYTRLIFMVIDALRSDFVLSEKKQFRDHMPFLRGRIKSHKTFCFNSKAGLPTVTMPRLKAITTGAPSDFGDIFSNIASSKLNTDSMLHQFHRFGLNMTFFGDNTWLKLFPGLFIRSDGTHSFYVSDYTEVDDNVTRHLDVELNKTDWNVMILHYLGLDHIGHLAGPMSPLVGPKLKEMDLIIQKIWSQMRSRDIEGNSRSLFVITGDHGMSDVGSHGGSSRPEILSPLIFIDSQNIGKSFDNEVVSQLDIASTITALFGLPIPTSSIGHPISLLFKRNASHLKSLQRQVACHFSQLASQVVTEKMLVEKVDNICKGVTQAGGFTDTKLFSEVLQELSPKFNAIFMLVGVIIMIFGVAMMATYTCYGQINFHADTKGNWYFATFLLLAFFLSLISMLSTSFVEEEHYMWYYFTSSFFVVTFITQLKRRQSIALLLCLLRLAMSWNQTGIKWIELKDLHDWFAQPENRNMFSLLICVAHFILFVLPFVKENIVGKIIYSICCCNIVLYRTAVLDLLSLNSSCFLARAIYFQVVLLAVLKWKQRIRRWKSCFILLGLLLMKLENIPWLALLISMEEIFTARALPCLVDNNSPASKWIVISVYIALAKFSHFSQGNSNSFATIDLGAGMVGFLEYSPILSNLVIFVTTYYAQLFWFLSYLDSMTLLGDELRVALVTILYESIVGTILCTIIFIQRYHLFIWSVYAPRFLYMLACTCLYLILSIFQLLKSILSEV